MAHVLTKIFTARICFMTYSYSIRSKTTRELIYKKFGEPVDVVEIVERELPSLGDHDVQVHMLAAPVNPADINTIQGRYPVKPKLPSVGGNEGVGIVAKVGKKVTTVQPGNKVIVIKSAQGTWRTEAIYNENVLKSVPGEFGTVEAATLMVNPCTAYRMLTDFKPVRKNNKLVVIQNGANSSVGQNVIQLCKVWGIKNINIIRDKPDSEELKKYLQGLGATHVLTEKELPEMKIYKEKLIARPVLGLNCIGGPNSSGLLKHLAPSGIMVTYGGMSKKPVKIPTGAFIFKNLKFVGFWMSRWHKESDKKCQDKMLTEIIDMTIKGDLKPSMNKLIAFSQYKEALSNTLAPKGGKSCKYILNFDV